MGEEIALTISLSVAGFVGFDLGFGSHAALLRLVITSIPCAASLVATAITCSRPSATPARRACSSSTARLPASSRRRSSWSFGMCSSSQSFASAWVLIAQTTVRSHGNRTVLRTYPQSTAPRRARDDLRLYGALNGNGHIVYMTGHPPCSARPGESPFVPKAPPLGFSPPPARSPTPRADPSPRPMRGCVG